MPRLRFHPKLQPLEARDVPAINLLYNGASLTLTGTPIAVGATTAFRVTGDGNNNFAVTDGALNLGTYHVTQDIRLRLASFDTNVNIILAGDSLRGSVLVDLGLGDTDPATPATVSLVNAAGAASVGGDVTFRGGSGQERFVLLTDESTIDIGGSVRAIGKPVTTPIEDTLLVGEGVEVHGGVTTSRITYTSINGTVDGDVTANAADSPGGMGFAVGSTGKIHGNVVATGGVTAPRLPDGTTYYSYARINGIVDGDVQFNITSGTARTSVNGTVGGDWVIHKTGGYTTCFVGSDGVVNGDFVVVARDTTDADSTIIEVDNLVRGNLRFREVGTAGRTFVDVLGFVAGDADIDLGGPGSPYASVFLEGAIGGSARIVGRGKEIHIGVIGYEGYGDYFGVPGISAVTDDLTVKLGDGSNSLTIDSNSGKAVGGKVKYTGGRGVDIITIAGSNTFSTKIKTGAGNDTVSFAPDATVGSASIDFGCGTDTWVPPAVIGFPLKLKNLP